MGRFCSTRSKIGRTCGGEIFEGGDQFKVSNVSPDVTRPSIIWYSYQQLPG